MWQQQHDILSGDTDNAGSSTLHLIHTGDSCGKCRSTQVSALKEYDRQNLTYIKKGGKKGM